MKTKEEIYKEHNGSPANRQKSLCEFIDLARVFSPNENKEYMKALQKSNTAFNTNSNICANYQDLHKMYGSLCEKPFVKKLYKLYSIFSNFIIKCQKRKNLTMFKLN
jgi:hypothetical protein